MSKKSTTSAAKSALLEKYRTEIAPALQKELNLSSKMAVPRIKAIKVNIGMGKWLAGGKDYAELEKNLSAITGQKASVNECRKSIRDGAQRARFYRRAGINYIRTNGNCRNNTLLTIIYPKYHLMLL